MTNTELAKQPIESFFNAFNAHDGQAYLKTIHFPHIRINAKGNVTISKDVSEYTPLETVLNYLAKNEGWHHSTLDKVELIDASEEKVHFKIQFSRYQADGTKYAVHNSLWIISKQDGKWGVLARSSFAP